MSAISKTNARRDPSSGKVVGTGRPQRREAVASASRFGAFMHGEPANGEQVIRRVREGYPADLLKHAGVYFNVAEKHIREIVGVAGSTAHRYRATGRPLDAAASERVHRMAIVTREAIEVFGDEQTAKTWMVHPNAALAGVPPLDLLDTEIGANAVRRILAAIAEGGVV